MLDQNRKYITGPKVRERYDISEVTLWRWENDEKLGFPKPMLVNRRKFYLEEEIIAWERARAAKAVRG